MLLYHIIVRVLAVFSGLYGYVFMCIYVQYLDILLFFSFWGDWCLRFLRLKLFIAILFILILFLNISSHFYAMYVYDVCKSVINKQTDTQFSQYSQLIRYSQHRIN